MIRKKCVNQIQFRKHHSSQNGHSGELIHFNYSFKLNFYVNFHTYFRYLKPILITGWKRPLEVDDIYAVTNSMRSDKNTDDFAKLWDIESKKKNPNILRVILKLHGTTVFTLGILYSIGETLAK